MAVRRAWTVAVRAAFACLVAAFVLRAPRGDWPWDPALLGSWKNVGWLVWLGVAGTGVAITLRGETFAKWARAVPRWRIDVALALVTILVVRHTSATAFHHYPQVMDEIAYDLLGRRISIFRPIPASHPLAEFFRVRFMVDDGGHNYPLFQPGWPMVIAIGYWLDLAKSIPAIATAALVVAGSRLGERLYGRFTGVLAGLFLLSSGFVGWVGASYFSHAWSAALYAFALERAVAALEDAPSKTMLRRALVGGVTAGWLVLTRVSIAAALLVPLAVVIASRAFELRNPSSRRRGVRLNVRLKKSARRPIAVYALATMLGVLAQMAWNGATTGSAFELPQDRYFALTEPNPRCHRLGFGDDIGCPHEHPGEVPKGGFGPARALEVDRIRWETFRTDAWGSAVPLLLVAVFCARRWRRRDAMVVASAAGPVVVSTFFYYHAIHHGARLWTESMPALGVMLASVVGRPFEEDDEKGARWRRAVSGLAFAVMLLCGVNDLAARNPQRAAENARDMQPDRITKNLDRFDVHHAVVYLHNCIEPDRADMILGWASVLDAVRPETGDRWFVRDFGPEMDRQLVAMLPGWRHVRATCDGTPIPFDDAKPSPRWIVTELESKFPMDHVDAYDTAVAQPLARESVALRLRIHGGGFVRFPQHVFETADYDVTLQYVRRLDGGRLRLSIDGVPIGDPLIGNGNDMVMRWTSPAPVPLSAGAHTFALTSPDGPGAYVIDLDRLELRAR